MKYPTNWSEIEMKRIAELGPHSKNSPCAPIITKTKHVHKNWTNFCSGQVPKCPALPKCSKLTDPVGGLAEEADGPGQAVPPVPPLSIVLLVRVEPCGQLLVPWLPKPVLIRRFTSGPTRSLPYSRKELGPTQDVLKFPDRTRFCSGEYS